MIRYTRADAIVISVLNLGPEPLMRPDKAIGFGAGVEPLNQILSGEIRRRGGANVQMKSFSISVHPLPLTSSVKTVYNIHD